MEGIVKTKTNGFAKLAVIEFSLSFENNKVIWKIGNDKFQMVLSMNLKDFNFQLKRLLCFQQGLILEKIRKRRRQK